MSQKIELFNSKNLDDVRAAINLALKSVEEQFGITLHVGNMGYTETTFKATIEAKTQTFKPKDYSATIGYAPIGTEFTVRGRWFKIVEHNPNRPVNPIVAVDKNGVRFKFPALAGKVKNS